MSVSTVAAAAEHHARRVRDNRANEYASGALDALLSVTIEDESNRERIRETLIEVPDRARLIFADVKVALGVWSS